jgi:hypothetical protein
MTSKNYVFTYLLTFFCQKYSRSATLSNPPPPLQLSFTAITDHPRQEKSGWAVFCSPARRQSEYQSVSGPWAVESAGDGRFAVRPVLSLLLRGLLAPHLFWTSSRNRQTLWCGDTSYMQRPSCTGIFVFRPRRSLTIGKKVRSNFTFFIIYSRKVQIYIADTRFQGRNQEKHMVIWL